MSLEKIGVEAVVEGLSKFQGDMKSVNSSLQGIRGEGTLLQRAFGAIGESISSFGATIGRIAEVALGVLLRDAIRAVIDGLKELVSETVAAGNEFQILELRLKRLNFNTLIEGGEDYNDAAEKAVELTKEQLKWLVLLAAQSPYDATDVANTFTLARSYGFAGDMAKGLTEDILDFSSGMGLTEVQVKRIIINFGQMVQQGKVTQREMNDLARGAFVPVNDVLKIMSEQTGVAMDAMDDFRATGESVPAFMKAFSTLVETRFAGATELMAKTFEASTDNVKDLVKGIFGLNSVKPVLDIIGAKVSEFADEFTKDPEKWDRMVSAASRIGEALGDVVSGLMGFLPTTGDMADNVIKGFEGIATWLEANRENIIGFFAGIGDTIRDKIVPFITDTLVPAFNRITEWVENNENVFILFFQTLKEIGQDVFDNFFGGEKGDSEGKGFLDTIQEIMWWVVINKDKLSEWIVILADLFVKWQIITTIGSVLIGFFISLLGVVLALVNNIAILTVLISLVGLPILALIAGIVIMANLWRENWDKVTTTLAQANFIIGVKFNEMKEKISTTLSQLGFIIKFKFQEFITTIKSKFVNFDWASLGLNIMRGIANGITGGAWNIISAATSAARRAFEAAKSYLGIHSPSTLFMEIGMDTMKGMAIGIQKAAGGAAATMQGAMAQVSSAATPSVTNSSVVNNSNAYNLTVNSNAQTEPILQDFNMMESLAGV